MDWQDLPAFVNGEWVPRSVRIIRAAEQTQIEQGRAVRTSPDFGLVTEQVARDEGRIVVERKGS